MKQHQSLQTVVISSRRLFNARFCDHLSRFEPCCLLLEIFQSFDARYTENTWQNELSLFSLTCCLHCGVTATPGFRCVCVHKRCSGD
jgi:hypothetical protein